MKDDSTKKRDYDEQLRKDESKSISQKPTGTSRQVVMKLGLLLLGAFAAAQLVFKRLLEPLINLEMLEKHQVSELHDLCQKKGLKLRFLDTWRVDNQIAVLIDGHVVGSATYDNRKVMTKNRAAKDALDKMKATFFEIGANLVKESDRYSLFQPLFAKSSDSET